MTDAQHRAAIVSPSDFPELFKFSRHVPPILLKQTMSTQAFNFFKKHANSFSIDFSSSSYLIPSIERFWGALLFVDISGFTALSTKMNVDDLRIHINAYFEKIISYADKYEGQTVKFAGDALYIIWQSPVYDLPEDPYNNQSISEDVVQRAVACALEINKNLSDYKIVFTPSIGITGSSMVDVDSNHHSDHPSNEEIAYLNVHSGLSVGMMAGLDVGANDRWEYLLVGSPLGDVAAAEDCASKGELIISEKAHNILHPNIHCSSDNNQAGSSSSGSPSGSDGPTAVGSELDTNQAIAQEQQSLHITTTETETAPVLCKTFPTNDKGELILPCRCLVRKEGCYLVHRDLSVIPATMNMMAKHTPMGNAQAGSGISMGMNSGNNLSIGSMATNSNSMSSIAESNANNTSGRRMNNTNLFDVNSNYNKRICNLMVDSFLEAFECWRNALVHGVTNSGGSGNAGTLLGSGTNSSSPTNAAAIASARIKGDNGSTSGSIVLASSSAGFTSPTALASVLVAPCRELQEEEQLSIQDLKNEMLKIVRHEFSTYLVTSSSNITNIPFGASPTSPTHGNANSNTNGFASISTTAAVLDQFRTWAFSTISAILAAHVHQTAREGFDFTILRHLQTFSEVISSYSPSTITNVGSNHHNRSQSLAVTSPSHHHDAMLNSGNNRRKFRGQSQDLPSMRLGSNVISAPSHMEADLTAELRNVIVLFIKIDMNFGDWMKNHTQQAPAGTSTDATTVTSPSISITSPTTTGGHQRSNSMFYSGSNGQLTGLGGNSGAGFQMKDKDINPVKIPKFHFLNRSKHELSVDYLLLTKFQKCMDILTTIFMEKGGQLRQFIVDDKGTVCIGTFGLRGAVNYDDAAAAIEAAKSIIVQLREAKMNAGIGITSGKAYCGLVGSPTRHEYAVMGPSVNLSARLMSKASYLQILCDDETKLRDRVHHFKDLGEIKAKGYVNPVRIYSPILSELNRHNVNNNENGGNRVGGGSSMASGAANSVISATAPVSSLVPGSSSTVTFASSTIGGSGGLIMSASGSILPVNAFMRGSDTYVTTGGVGGTGGAALRRRRVRNSFLTEHLRSSFNINSEANISLYGRKVEIDTLLRYLLRKVSSHSSSNSGASLPQIDLNASPLFVCIAGVCGIGKTVFLNEICRVIAKVNENNMKVAVFRKRISSYSSSEPFHAWRSVFREMMQFLSKVASSEGSSGGARGNANKGTSSEDSGSAEMNSVDQVLQGVKIIETAMSDAGDIMSLLSSINFLPIESDVTSDIESLGPLSLLRSVELLAKIVQTFVNRTKHLVVIAFDDLQWIDFYSWLLIQKVWSEDRGAVLLTTYQTVSAGRVNKRNISTSTFVNVQETFSDPDRTLIMDLNPIDAPAIELLVKEVLERNNYPTASKEKLYTLIFELSGGNPLYAYELIKVCVDQASHNSAKVKEDPSLCAFVKDFKSNRVEEVIYFRFDQLDAASQTVLKVSSIICVFGAPISVPMLEFMILEDANGNDDSDSEEANAMMELRRQSSQQRGKSQQQMITMINVVAVLRDLLTHNEFLSMVVRERGEIPSANGTSSPQKKSVVPTELLALNSPSSNNGGSGGGGIQMEQLALLDDQILREMHFEFSASIEQHAIYDLMLEDQKHYLHRRVASYYEKVFESRRGGRGTPSELFECGLHLESATRYHEAFPYFYRSASILSNLGSAQLCHQQLDRAHKLLRQMKANLTFSNESAMSLQHGNSHRSLNQQQATSSTVSPRGTKSPIIIDESSIIQDSHHHHQANGHRADASERHRRSLSDITRALQTTDVDEPSGLMQISKFEAFKMFQGRVDLLETAISIMLKIAQFKLLTFQEVNAAATYYEEAFHLILISLVNMDDNDSTNGATSPKTPAAKRAGEDQSLTPTDADTVMSSSIELDDPRKVISIINGRYYWKETSYENFYLQDYALLFRALSGIIFLYRLAYIKDEPFSGKESEAIKWFLYLSNVSSRVCCPMTNMVMKAGDIGVPCINQAVDQYQPLEYLGLAFKYHCFSCNNNHTKEECNEVIEKIMQGYQVTLHSKDILQVNFFDPVPASVCSALLVQVLRKDEASTNRILSHVMSMIREINHSSTMAMLMIPLCTSLVLLKRCEEAYDIYHKFYISLDEEAHVLNKFTDIKKPFYEWLRLMKHADSNGIDLPGDDGDVSYYFPNKFLLRVLNNPKLRHTLARIRPITHSCCDFIGAGKEYIHASILFFHVMLALKFNKGVTPSAKDEPLDKCLVMAKFYIDQSIANTAVKSESYFFCHVMSLLMKVRIIAKMCKRNPLEFTVQDSENEVNQVFLLLENVLAAKGERFEYLEDMVTKLKKEAIEMIHCNDEETETIAN